MTDEKPEPEEVVDAASIDVSDEEQNEGKTGAKSAQKRKRTPAVERPFPRKTLEEALRVPTVVRSHNGGKPYAPSEVAKALGLGMSGNFYYLTAASRDFGLTEGSRETATISLTDLGRQAVYPQSDDQLAQALLEAFLSVEIFRQVVEHYGGSELPGEEFVRNTLETEYGLDPRVHDEFLDLFEKNCRYVGIGAEFTGIISATPSEESGGGSSSAVSAVRPAARTSDPAEGRVCFVAMPFSEKSDHYATGFFDEVFASLFKPAIEGAGFVARTAKRQGSDVIHATIVNELLDADLVLADLTEHNPNVLFELGLRMAKELPIALVRAKGTNPIFDVDNMLRVESYNPNLWPSTVEKDVPRLTAHIEEAWSRKDSETTYLSMLRRV